MQIEIFFPEVHCMKYRIRRYGHYKPSLIVQTVSITAKVFMSLEELVILCDYVDLPWEWCHDDAETSAFNVNIRLFML